MSEPQRPKFSAGVEAWEEYDRAYSAWILTPEGIAETDRRKREEEERKRIAEERYEKQVVERIPVILARLEIPPRALVLCSGQAEHTDAIGAAAGALDMLVLSGGPGCGKTVAAALWIAEYVKDRKNWGRDSIEGLREATFVAASPIWLTAAKLARWERYDDEKMTALLKTPRLVLDDLGGEFMDKGGFYASLLDELVNERQANSRPTIITTNLDADAFKVRYGDRIVDRIREGGRFFLCGNKSLRKKGS